MAITDHNPAEVHDRFSTREEHEPQLPFGEPDGSAAVADTSVDAPAVRLDEEPAVLHPGEVTSLPSAPDTAVDLAPSPEPKVAPAETKRPRRIGRIAGGFAAAAALLGLGAAISSGGSSEEDTPRAPSDASAGEALASPDSAVDVPRDNSDTESPSSIPDTSVEVVEPVDTGIYLTATTAEGLMSEFEQDLECMYGGQDASVRPLCLMKLTGGREGELTDLLRQRIQNVNEYWVEHPNSDYEYDFSWEIDENQTEITDFLAVIVARVSSPDGTSVKRYTFQSIPAPEEAVAEQGVSEIWALVSEDTISS